MKYVENMDEIIVAPPYNLGADDKHGFEAHYFQLPSTVENLQRIANRHLNQPFLPEGKGGSGLKALDEHGNKVTLNYVVPASAFATLSFLRYWVVDATHEMNLGNMSYTEALISFRVVRQVNGEETTEDAALEFLPMVYIDGMEFEGIATPYAIPICSGRELFGMPKVAAKISYVPNRSDFELPKVSVWSGADNEAMGFEDYISFEASGDTGLTEPNENQLDGDVVITNGELEVSSILVGLQQAPDPCSTGGELQALHQSVIEVPIQRYIDDPPKNLAPGSDATIRFLNVNNKPDIIKEFGLETIPDPKLPGGSRLVEVKKSFSDYRRGHWVFAEPSKTKVWQVVK